MPKLILLRHGQSQWNELNIFTGWVDVSLTIKGAQEAALSAQEFSSIEIHRIFTSTLNRAQMTASIAMNHHAAAKPLVFLHPEGNEKDWGEKTCLTEALDMCIPTHVDWRLNERFYGNLQGMNKDEARAKFGKKQIHIWRRSFDVAPPGGESLKMTAERTLPYFKEQIIKFLKKGENILVAAHGNSLRAIVMYLEELKPEEIIKFEIPTGKPLIYDYSDSKFKRANG